MNLVEMIGWFAIGSTMVDKKVIVEKIERLDRLASHGIKTLKVIHLDKYKANRDKRREMTELLKKED